MAEIKIFDLQDYEELSDDKAKTIYGGSDLSKFLRRTFGIPEIDFLNPKVIPTESTPIIPIVQPQPVLGEPPTAIA